MFGIDRCLVYTDYFSKDFLLWDCIKRLVYYTGFWFIQGSVEKIFTVLVKCDVLLIFICIITERNTNNKKDYSYGYCSFTSCEITMAT